MIKRLFLSFVLLLLCCVSSWAVQLTVSSSGALGLGSASGTAITFSVGGFGAWSILGTNHLVPSTDNANNLGAAGNRVATAFTVNINNLSRLVGSNQLVPTLAGTGFGTSPTISLDTGSGDFDGGVTVTTGTTPGSSGTLTITFSTCSAYGANSAHCTVNLKNGTVSWNARATAILGTESTLSAVVNWDNNAVTLGAGTVKFNYHCPAN